MFKLIHCIGDSHASFFSGRNSLEPIWPLQARDIIPSFKSYRLGAVLAYNLCEPETSTHGKEKLAELTNQLPKNSSIMLCFGEIDCRVHLVKQSIEQNRNIGDVVNECVDRYFSVIRDMKTRFNMMVWAVVPSTISETVTDLRYPHFGTNLERNQATKLFNERLEELCKKEKIAFISIFNELIKPNGSTNNSFFIDNAHLSQKAMPLVIKRFKKTLPCLDLHLFRNKILPLLPFQFQFILFSLKCQINTMIYRLYTQLKFRVKNLLINILGKKISRKIKSILCGSK